MLSAEPSHEGEEGEEDKGGVASHPVVDVPLNTASHHQRNETQKKSSSRTDFQCFHRVVNNKGVDGLVRASTGQPTGEKPAASLTWSFKSQNRQPSDEKKSLELTVGLVPSLYAGKRRSEVRDATANKRFLPPIQGPSPTCTMPTTSEISRSADLDQKTAPFTSTQSLDTTTTRSSTPSADPSSALHPPNSPIAPTFPLTTPSPLNHIDSLVRDISLTSTTFVYDSQRNNIGSTTNGDVALRSTRPGAEKYAPTHSFPSSSWPNGFSEGTNPPLMPSLTTEIQHNGASSVPAACMPPVPPTILNMVAKKRQKKAPNTQEVTTISLSSISERDQFSSLTSPISTTQTLVSSESKSSKRMSASVANDDGQQPSSDDSNEASDSNANRGSLPIQLRKSTDCLLFAATLLEQDTTDPAPESKGRHVGKGVDKSLQEYQDSSSLAAKKLWKAKKKNPDPRTLASVAAQVPPVSKDGGATGENLTTPREADVLCGRGGLINKHPGNIVYRKVVDYNKPYYQSVQKKHRILVSQSIVQTILNNRGRFLILGSRGGTWMEIGFKRAVQKTSQALRERTSAPDEGQQKDGDEDNNESGGEAGDVTMESGDEGDHCDWESDEDE